MKKLPPPKKFTPEERIVRDRAIREAINPTGASSDESVWGCPICGNTEKEAAHCTNDPTECPHHRRTAARKKSAVGTWSIKGGLRNGELLLLQRALAMYHKEYLILKNLSPDPAEKNRMQDYVDASDALARRLRYELQREPA